MLTRVGSVLHPHGASFFELPGLNHGEAGQAADQYVPRLIEFFNRVVIDAPATA